MCMTTLLLVPKTIQIRNVDDDVYAGLVRRAGEEGITVPELLRREAGRLAKQPTMKQWLERLPPPGSSTTTTAQVQEALDELRGPWPDAGR